MHKALTTRWVQLGLILLLASLILSYKVDKPFIGHHDWNSVVYSNIARNYLRYGLYETKLGQVRNAGRVDLKQFNYVTHYPPLLPIMISVSFKIFGINEIAARLVPIASSFVMLICIYLIGETIDSRIAGILACIFAMATPLFIYFGKLPVHETVVPAFSLVVLLGYLLLLRTNKLIYYLLVLLGIVGGGLVNWTGYYMSLPIVLHVLISRPKLAPRLRKLLFLLPLICVGLFGLHILHLRLLTGTFAVSDLYNIFLFRINQTPIEGINDFTLKQYLVQEFQYSKIYFTNILLCLVIFWIIRFAKNIFMRKFEFSDTVIVMLLGYGIIHPLLFKNLFYIHDYMIYYLLPFVVLASSLICKKIFFRLSSTVKYALPILLVIFMFFERAAFTNALLESNTNSKGVEIGKFIGSHTNSTDTVFLTSNNYKEFYEVFIAYYADRKVDYGEVLPYDKILTYKLIVRPKAHDALSFQDKQFLDDKLVRNEDDKYIWYLN